MRILYLFAVAFVVSLAPLAWVALRSYLKYRGEGVLTCPETGKPVAVELDAKRVAATEMSGDRRLLLKSCSRWPERSGCGQECLAAVESSPEDCLVRTRLTRWYAGARCALCGRDIGKICWTEHQPALMSPERRTMEWGEVPAEALPSVLQTHYRICWSCHVAESFRARFPDLVLDDPLRAAPRPSDTAA
jgi:hypothetical protein